MNRQLGGDLSRRTMLRILAECLVLLVLLQCCGGEYNTRCKWSNEECEKDEECCSERCVKLHEGTNPRCSKSPLHGPCYAFYQCEEGLTCGDKYNCCAPHWGVCSDVNDCCEEDHVCREEEGFTYERCLLSAADGGSIFVTPMSRGLIIQRTCIHVLRVALLFAIWRTCS